MRRTCHLRSGLFTIASAWAVVGFAAPDVWDRAVFERSVLLMPQQQRPLLPGGLQTLEREAKRKITPAEKELFARLYDGAWRRHADEWISFEIPDSPLLKLGVITPESRQRIRIVGDAMSTTDRGFTRAYRLTVNKQPYGVILLGEADWFDDGICFCGPIVLKRQLIQDGTLLEFSLLPEGQVKKVQALGAKHRAVLFEWTHSALTPAAYQRIGASIRLAQPATRTRDEWIEITRQKRPDDLTALIGWLDPGTPEADITRLLGAPSRRQNDQLVYEKEEWQDDGSGERQTETIPLKDGQFLTLPADYARSKALPPRQGSLAWACELVHVEDHNQKAPKLDPAAVKLAFEQFKQQAVSTQDANAWNRWCMVIYQLAKRDQWDVAVLPIVRRRFLDSALYQHYSAWIIHEYKAEGRESLFRQRLELVLNEYAKPRDRQQTDANEAWNLLHFMELKEQASLDLLRRALNHPHDTIRSSAYGSGEALPASEARQAARHAIETEDNDHGLIMATYLIRDVGTAEDVAWFTAAKPRFKTKEQLKRWQEALEDMQKRPAAKP